MSRGITRGNVALTVAAVAVVLAIGGVATVLWRPLAQLVPRNATAAELELYGGLDDTPPLALRRSAHLDAAGASALAAALDGLPRARAERYLCPMDDGAKYVATIHYADAADVRFRIDARGCGWVHLDDSPQPAATTMTSPGFDDMLDRLLSG